MPLDAFAADRGVTPEIPMTVGRWLEEHPDVRDEIIEGWKKGFPVSVISSYLQEEHDCPFTMPSIRGWLVVIAGARGH